MCAVSVFYCKLFSCVIEGVSSLFLCSFCTTSKNVLPQNIYMEIILIKISLTTITIKSVQLTVTERGKNTRTFVFLFWLFSDLFFSRLFSFFWFATELEQVLYPVRLHSRDYEMS